MHDGLSGALPALPTVQRPYTDPLLIGPTPAPSPAPSVPSSPSRASAFLRITQASGAATPRAQTPDSDAGEDADAAPAFSDSEDGCEAEEGDDVSELDPEDFQWGGTRTRT